LDTVPIPRDIPFLCLTDVGRARAIRRSTIGMPDPRSLVCAGSCTSSRALGGAIALGYCTVQPSTPPLRLRCAAISTSPRKRADPYGEQHETIWAHKAPGTPRVCLGKGIRRCPMGGLVLVAPVSSDVLIWAADGSFYIHILGAWPASSSEKMFLAYTESLGAQNTQHPPPDGLF
jgi:hypothetical protein